MTQISKFWFAFFSDTDGLNIPTHFITADFDEMPAILKPFEEQLRGRAMLVRKLTILPVEAIVRGYITGSAWVEYCSRGTVCGIHVKEGLVECAEFDEPLFTPSTKAELGDHGSY